MNGQFIGTFPTGPALPPVRQYDPAHPERGGWDGVGLTYHQPYIPFALLVWTSTTARGAASYFRR